MWLHDRSFTMYAFAALALLGSWYLLVHVYHVTSGYPYLLMVAAMLSVAMHVAKKASAS
jgi:hypothetical protein